MEIGGFKTTKRYCPNMHYLQFESGPKFQCAVCSKEYDGKEQHWRCPTCNYNICPECFEIHKGSPLIGPKSSPEIEMK